MTVILHTVISVTSYKMFCLCQTVAVPAENAIPMNESDSALLRYLKYWIREQEVSVHIILTKLFTGIQAE